MFSAVSQGKARWEPRCCAQNDIAHCAQQCTEGGGDPGWRLPPLGQMQRFLPNLSTCHWAQSSQCTLQTNTTQCTAPVSVRSALWALSCYCTYFTALLGGGRVSLPSRGELNCCSAAAAHWQVAPNNYHVSRLHSHHISRIFLGYLFWNIFSEIFRGNFKFYSQDVSWICKDSCGHLFIIL